ncbi:MAG: 4Fe-4S binding protein [[Clostridium] scindens]
MSQTDCVGCGQCRVVCPTGAISIKAGYCSCLDSPGR